VPERSTVNGDLLDGFLADRTPRLRLYEPSRTEAVLGAAGKAERDLKLAALAADGVPVQRRRGGGGAVVLSPGQVVLALVTEVASAFRNLEYARAINEWFIEALAALGVGGVEHRGITDLALRGRKVLGTSIYRSRLVLFYQASLLVSNDVSLFGRYLEQPRAEPDYRQGRDHAAFCTTLRAEGFDLDPGRLISALSPVAQRQLEGLA
jgi:lipoate-protein ligase A